MEEHDQTRVRIMQGALELFLKYGIRSVSMDDIARHLSISKKTIYQYFIDKDDIVTQSCSHHMDHMNASFEELTKVSKNALDELMRIQIFMRNNMQELNPSLLFDLKKYHAKAWSGWLDHKNRNIRESVVSNLKRGMEEGLYRTNLNAEILATLRVESIQWIYDGQLTMNEKFKMIDVQTQMLDHFMYGLLTDKGRKLYEKYKQEPTNLELIPHNL